MKGGGLRKVLVGRVTKEIYGTLLGAVFFYNKLKRVLVDMDFKVNEYDECTFNKMINDTQCTIQFNVENLKLSHLQQEEFNKVIDHLNGVFGSNEELLVALYGKMHEYLEITID